MTGASQAVVAAATEGCSVVAAAAPPFEVIRTSAQAESFLADHDAFLFDCDGVLWRGARWTHDGGVLRRGTRWRRGGVPQR